MAPKLLTYGWYTMHPLNQLHNSYYTSEINVQILSVILFSWFLLQ